LNQIILLLRLYFDPLKTFSRILDEGRLIFAALAAVAVLLAIQIPRTVDYELARANEVRQRIQANAARIAAERKAHPKTEAADSGDDESDEEGASERAAYLEEYQGRRTGAAPITLAIDRFTLQSPTQYFAPLLAMAVCFVPMAILILTLWDNLGGFTTILFRDYMALLVCCLMAWVAPHLLALIVNMVLGAAHLPAHNHPAIFWTAHAWFLFLVALAIRPLVGTKFSHALGATAGAWTGAVSGVWMYSMFGGISGYLASPFVLYYLYRGFSPDFGALGISLTSRQRLKQGLENATLNPRDADAHYQLGLIFLQRRQYDPAIERFRKAIEIDPKEADSYYQLGRIAREQGRYSEAIEFCRTAARIDDKHSSSEVWRELGIAYLLAGEGESACQSLERYLERRPYDPEGLCWHGRVLVKLGQNGAARAAFDQAIEAVRTMPPARKRQVRSWESEARRELKKLPTGDPASVTA
jgi:tetratricopeptide (TPR) repeat protein